MKNWLKPPIAVGESVAVEIDSKIFFSSVKTISYDPEKKEYTYTLSGLKGYNFDEQDLSPLTPDKYFHINNDIDT